jgi:hypothetical protein
MTARVTWVLLLTGVLGPATASAQYDLPRDVRVRILAPAFSEKRPVGTIAGVDSAGLRLVRGRTDTVFIPRDAVMAVDVSAGRRSHWVRGATIGGLSGVAFATVVWIVDKAGEEDDPLTDALDTMFYPVAAAALGLTGALVGGVIGAIARTEQWDRIPASDIRWAIEPGAGGVRAGVTLRF